MADKSLKSGIEIDREIIRQYNESLKKSVDRERMLTRFNEWRGNKLPPFSIEHLPNERDRVFGMTSEDRFLRKQWLNDQLLTAREPVYVPELYPKNIIRRTLAAPWNVFFNALRPVLGDNTTQVLRITVPKYIVGLMVFWGACSYINYHPKTWENLHGWDKLRNKPRQLLGEPDMVYKERSDFTDHGFKSRKACLNLDTSTSQ